MAKNIEGPALAKNISGFPMTKKSKLPKVYEVQVTQGIQSPSLPRYKKSKFPKVPNAQVAQSPSHPKPKFPKVQVTQGVQSPSHPRCSKSKLPKLPKVQVAKNIYGSTMARYTFKSHYSQIPESIDIFPCNLLFLIISLLS